MAEFIGCDQCHVLATGFVAGQRWWLLRSPRAPLDQSEDRHFCSWECLRVYATGQVPTWPG